ncbi:MAG: OsmC family protein [Azospirillaceae bacterium]
MCGSSGDDGDAGVPPPAHFLAAAIAWHEASYQALAAEFGITVHCVHVDARLDQQDDAPITSPPERGPRCRIHLAVTVESPASLAEIARLRAAVMARCPAIGFLRAGAALSVGLEHVIPLGRKAAA